MFLSLSATDANNDAFCMALCLRTFTGVCTTVAVIIEDISNITTLNDSAAGISHKALNLVEEDVVKLLPW